MKQNILVLTITGALGLSIVGSADAALIEKLGGLAYYDDVADLTWLKDANYSQTSGFDSNGLMNWTDANAWAAGLNIAGVTGWRLPTSDACGGENCNNSEMGNLYYNVLGNSFSNVVPAPSINTGPFINVRTDEVYWTSTLLDGSPTFAWFFGMERGTSSTRYYGFSKAAWAVKSGDVGAVPVPAAAWLFGSGLIGLVGVARRRRQSAV